MSDDTQKRSRANIRVNIIECVSDIERCELEIEEAAHELSNYRVELERLQKELDDA